MDEPRLTRLTTQEERENIAGITLDQGTVDYFLDLVNKGLVSAAAAHDDAVQEDMALSAEVTIRLNRPARADNGEVVEVVGRELVTGQLKARKVFKDPDKKPIV